MTQNEIGTKISPVIQDNKVISLRINGKKIPLKSKIDVTEFVETLLEPLNKLTQYIDLPSLFHTEMKIEEWARDELEDFLRTLSEIQLSLLRTVFHYGRLPREKLVAEVRAKSFELDSKRLAGVVAGLNRRIALQNREKLFFIVSGEYTINDDYYEMLQEIFHIEKMKRRKGYMLSGTNNQFVIARHFRQEY